MKNEYETEITSIMETHKAELDEIESVFKEDLDKKESEIFKALKEKNDLMEEYEAFKYHVKMQEAEREI